MRGRPVGAPGARRSPPQICAARRDRVRRAGGFPTEVDHYPLGRVIDVYVRPEGEDLGRIAGVVTDFTGKLKLPANTEVDVRGMVQNMRTSFKSLAPGLILAVALPTWF